MSSNGKKTAKCTKCGSHDTYFTGSGGMVPPGHPVAALAVGAYKLAQRFGAAPAWHRCNQCGELFSAAPMWE